jgi:GH24 family phage-related lysozyme (muramidase)
MVSSEEFSELSDRLEQYEGRVPHMYVDTEGYVTVGVGHQIQNAVAAAALNFWSSGTKVATVDEKKAEFDRIAKEPKAKLASYYAKIATLFLKDPDIDFLTKQHIEGSERDLRAIYPATAFPPGFDKFPTEVRLALFDMVFNLGLPKLRSGYPTFNAAVAKQDWEGAGQQCHRQGIPQDRNDYVKDLFQRAADAKKAPK